MPVLRSFFEARGIENPAQPLTSTVLLDALGGDKTLAGVSVNPKKSLGLSGVWRSTALLSGGVAGLPLNAYRQGSYDPIESAFLNSPHPDLTDYEFWELAMVHMLLWGNFYARISRQGVTSNISYLEPIHPSRVSVERVDDDDPALSKRFVIDGGKERLTKNNIFHVPGMGYDGLVGLSVIGCARQSLAVALAAEEYAARLFGSGSLQTGILSYQGEKNLGDDDVERIKTQWNSRHRGVGKAHEVAVMPKNLKWESISIPPEDAQFIQGREFQTTEIARWFGVPPHMLFDVTKTTSWGTGIEHQSIGFVIYSLRPWLRRIEKRVSQELLPGKQYAKFTVEGLLRGDTKTRYSAYATGRQWGWFSVNEIRAKEDMPPIEGGDEYLQPLNMQPLGAEIDEEEPEVEPEEQRVTTAPAFTTNGNGGFRQADT